jgi:hypothetical protein
VRASWAVSRGGAGCACYVCQNFVLPRMRAERATEARLQLKMQLAARADALADEMEAIMELAALECVVCEPEAIRAFEGVGECMGPVGQAG